MTAVQAMRRHCDDCREKVRPGTGREAGLGHAGGRVKLPLLLTPLTCDVQGKTAKRSCSFKSREGRKPGVTIHVGDAGAVTE